MASIKLYLDTRAPRKDGTYPLKLLVTHKQPFMISLKIYLQEDQWLGNEVINHKEKKAFNIFIQQRFITIKKLLLTLEGEGKLKSLSPKQLKEKIENINSFENTESENISYLFKNHMEKCIGEKTNPRTRELYQYTLNKIKEFADIDKLTFEDMDLAWMKSFDRFMSDTCGVNARSIHFRNIRSVFNDAIDEEAISQNVYPFRKFKIKKEATPKRSLAVDELVLLRDYPCEEYLEKYRDIFMLIFYLIGINIIDLLHLKEIRKGNIEYRRAKTGRLYTIKVLPEAQVIFDKYKGKDYLLDVLDVYSNYKDFTHRLNRNLKRIGRVEIGKKGKKEIVPLFPELTTYYARHTWATIAASLEIPKETIAAALGHGGNTVTDIYINFDQKKIETRF